MRVTADVAPIGSLGVSVLEPQASRVLAHGQVTRSATDGTVHWRDSPPDALGPHRAPQRMRAHGARLYSFSFASGTSHARR